MGHNLELQKWIGENPDKEHLCSLFGMFRYGKRKKLFTLGSPADANPDPVGHGVVVVQFSGICS